MVREIRGGGPMQWDATELEVVNAVVRKKDVERAVYEAASI